MQRTNFIKMTKVNEVKAYAEKLQERQTPILVTVRKTRTKGETHEVTIEGAYGKFCTVKNQKTGLSFTIQYIDVLTGGVEIAETDRMSE